MITGFSNGFHDAAMAIIDDDGNIIYAGHAERYSRKKNDHKHSNLMPKQQGTSVFYEKPFSKNTRRLFSGQPLHFNDRRYDHYINHHWSHAAAAYYTRPFDEEPVCVVIDAIGEWDTASIWYNKKKVWSMKYPKSLGLMYSAATAAVGLKPMEDEYILMGMAAFGTPAHYNQLKINYNKESMHKGLNFEVPAESMQHLASSAQLLIEGEIIKIMCEARKYSRYLCYGGGVALNCVANSKIFPMFKKMWILPNPGDAGSALGAAAAHLDKKLNWIDPYLGYDMDSNLNPKEIAHYLSTISLCGVASGRAEYGPRALGNRSLLADPRKDIKDTVNKIKHRQLFRPFAPAILEEFADQYFGGPMNEYMQFTAIALHDYQSVTHVDNTARVQLVKKDCNSILRKVLEEFYTITKCPMLLNTSLNIKGQPIVNDAKDADEFQSNYGVKVFY